MKQILWFVGCLLFCGIVAFLTPNGVGGFAMTGGAAFGYWLLWQTFGGDK